MPASVATQIATRLRSPTVMRAGDPRLTARTPRKLNCPNHPEFLFRLRSNALGARRGWVRRSGPSPDLGRSAAARPRHPRGRDVQRLGRAWGFWRAARPRRLRHAPLADDGAAASRDRGDALRRVRIAAGRPGQASSRDRGVSGRVWWQATFEPFKLEFSRRSTSSWLDFGHPTDETPIPLALPIGQARCGAAARRNMLAPRSGRVEWLSPCLKRTP